MHHPVRHQGITEEPTLKGSPITHDALHPLFNPVTGEPGLTQSSSRNVNSAEPNQVTQPPDHLIRWTKDHPLDNIVGNPSRPVSTRKQLVSDALWCCFHTELSKVKPKNFKMAMIEDCWFQAMQDEIYEFDRLKPKRLLGALVVTFATAYYCLATNRKFNFSSDEGSLKLKELTNLVTKLSERIGVLEDDLRKTKKTYSSTFTKLILRVKKLEARVKIGKARKRAQVVLSEDNEDVEDDSSKQGRKLSDAEVQEKASTETEPIIQEVTPTEVIQDQESSEKGSAEVSTAGATKGTASEVPVVSTAEEKTST
ncbi:hypothetical protein Tco_0227708 [Tanacetum coccineum]